MEDHIGDIIYIIITVVFVAIGLIRQSFKQQQQPPPSVPKRTLNPFDPMDEEWMDHMDESDITQNTQREYHTNVQMETPFNDVLETIPEQPEAAVKEGETAIKEKKVILHEEEELSDIELDFNLRNAILYNAILDRPKF